MRRVSYLANRHSWSARCNLFQGSAVDPARELRTLTQGFALSPAFSAPLPGHSLQIRPVATAPTYSSKGPEMPPPFRKESGRARVSTSAPRGGHARRASKTVVNHAQPQVPPDFHDMNYIRATYSQGGSIQLRREIEENPRNHITRFMQISFGQNLNFEHEDRVVGRNHYFRAKINTGTTIGIIGQGDATSKKEAERLACLSALLQLQAKGFSIENPVKLAAKVPAAVNTITLSNGEAVDFETARSFMDYYCRRYGFGKPDIVYEEPRGKKGSGSWDAVMTVGGRRIGIGSGAGKKQALIQCHLDVTQYLESCDKDLWITYKDAVRTGKDGPAAPKVQLQMSEALGDEIRDLCGDIKQSHLYRNRPRALEELAPTLPDSPTRDTHARPGRTPLNPSQVAAKSQRLAQQLAQYREDPRLAKMRDTRQSLPVYSQSSDLLTVIHDNEVTICMAATGSGKTTQVPQLILDQWIDEGRGAECNIICTQPRRIAAISVAQRVANERGEELGKSVGYQVRFEHRLPLDHGSITFCTTGIFLKWMQSALDESTSGTGKRLDHVTHVIVDEVHERDIDTDLLLVVLKRLLADRKARGVPIKIILMSATIEPKLFREYFRNDSGELAPISEIPGRSFPVVKRFLDEILQEICGPRKLAESSWVFGEKSVANYIASEIGPQTLTEIGFPTSLALTRHVREDSTGEDLDMPFPLIALTVAHVLARSEQGHVLVFLPGWEEIQHVQKLLLGDRRLLGINFRDNSKYVIHVLHSAVPIAEQQAVFEPAPEGVRRIILSTNIAETSVTIPDVVYVVDTGKVKEQRYDPDRHVSSLVSAWVGSSNLNQRAGRAGRHRPGEYYGLVSNQRVGKLPSHQLVEIKRVDLSNIVMHVKALNFPGMEVEEVLAQAIEPPAPERIAAAIQSLKMVGALDEHKRLTSLGRVLLQIPLDVQIGRLVLFGSFFKCLDPALTLAAILTSREPFVNPPLLKKESRAAREIWSPKDFRSDPLAALNAYNAWWQMQSRGEYNDANRFCSDNFLSKPSLMNIQKLKGHLLQSLYHAGVIEVSAGGVASKVPGTGRIERVPPHLNANAESTPLLAAMIAIGSQPNFAIRVSEKILRTAQDKVVLFHPSSVNSRKRESSTDSDGAFVDKQLFAFAEKVRNVSTPGSSSNAGTFLKTNTRLDPMTYMLFGAYNIAVEEKGLKCDDWLPIVGNLTQLDSIQELKTLLDHCMLRVFEGIVYRRRAQQKQFPNSQLQGLREEEEDDDEEDEGQQLQRNQMSALSTEELNEFDFLTRDITRVLDRFSEERMRAPSWRESRPATPSAYGSPSTGARLSLPLSGYSTPYRSISPWESRPATPSNLRKSYF